MTDRIHRSLPATHLLVAILALAATSAIMPTSTRATAPGSLGAIAYPQFIGAGSTIAITEASNTREVSIANCYAGSNPSWSPDGTTVAFQTQACSGTSGREGIYIANANGEGVRQLTHNGGEWDQMPTWSPDNAHVAFIRAVEGGGTRSCESQPGGSSNGTPTPEAPVMLASTTSSEERVLLGCSQRVVADIPPLSYAKVEWSPTNPNLLAGWQITEWSCTPSAVCRLGVRLALFNTETGTAATVSPGAEYTCTNAWQCGAPFEPSFDWLPDGSGILVIEADGVHEVKLTGEDTLLPGTQGAVEVHANPEGDAAIVRACKTCERLEEDRLPDPAAENTEEPEHKPFEPSARGRSGRAARAATALHSMSFPAGVAFQPQHLPIIFLPGFAASELSCEGKGVFPPTLAPFNVAPELKKLNLKPDGVSNENCTNVEPGEPIHKVLGKEIAEKVREFLAELKLPDGTKWPTGEFGWDWRKRPQESIERLERLVTKLLKEPSEVAQGASRVVLYAHSYGGLLTKAFLSQHKEQVARVLTIGTPYRGAPKALFPLAFGVETPLFSVGDFLKNQLLDQSEFQEFARNLAGAYELFPTPQYGPWLTEHGNPLQVNKTVFELFGNTSLLKVAQEDHVNIFEGFPAMPPNERIPYQMVVGAGIPTPVGIDLTRTSPTTANVIVSLGNGDETVPLKSASQEDLSPLAPYHTQTLCGVPHMAEPGNPKLLAAYKEYLMDGTTPKKLDTAPCTAAAGGVWTLSSVNGLSLGPQPSPFASRAAVAPSVSPPELTLEEAAEEELADVFLADPQVIAIVDRTKPVELRFQAEDETLTYTPYESEAMGATASYGPVTGDVVLEPGTSASTPTVTLDGVPIAPTVAPTGGGTGGGQGPGGNQDNEVKTSLPGPNTTGITPAQIAALLLDEITPSGRAAKAAKIRKAGGYRLAFKALEAGTAVIDWYQVPPRAKAFKKTKPVLVAGGQATFTGAESATIKIRLTAAGKRLLKGAKQVKLTAKGVFTPPHAAAITVAKAFVLKR